MVSTKTLPVRNGSPVQVRYPLRDPATYALPHLMFILRLMIPKSIILLALWTAGTAFGNTIIVTGIDSAMGIQSISMDENGAATPIYWSGAIDINVDGYIRQVFCVQLFTDIYLNTTYDTVMDYSDTANLKRVGWLLQNEFPTAALYTGAALQTAGAAFQLAIWDIIEDNGDGFAPGAGKLTQSTDASNPTDPAVLAAAIQYETLSAGQSSDYGIVYHNYLSGTPMQNLMGGPVTDGGPSATPEPGTVILIFGGLAMIAVGRLRRRPPR